MESANWILKESEKKGFKIQENSSYLHSHLNIFFSLSFFQISQNFIWAAEFLSRTSRQKKNVVNFYLSDRLWINKLRSKRKNFWRTENIGKKVNSSENGYSSVLCQVNLTKKNVKWFKFEFCLIEKFWKRKSESLMLRWVNCDSLRKKCCTKLSLFKSPRN